MSKFIQIDHRSIINLDHVSTIGIVGTALHFYVESDNDQTNPYIKTFITREARDVFIGKIKL